MYKEGRRDHWKIQSDIRFLIESSNNEALNKWIRGQVNFIETSGLEMIKALFDLL